MNFIELTDKQQLKEIDDQSRQRDNGVLIFKHSTRCAISSMVYSRFQRGWNLSVEELPVYYLDLIRYREISNAIARDFDVQHESPQVLLIKDGQCVYHRSHQAIAPQEIINEATNA